MDNENVDSEREIWETPVIRTVVPIDRTAGGVFNKNDQDNAFYKTS